LTSSTYLTTFAFFLYISVVLFIGFVAYRKTNDATDYFLGGRRLGPRVAAISAGASDMSGWTLLGLPGFAYLAGAESAWIALGLILGVAASWVLVAKRLRSKSQKLNNAITIPMYLHNRFQAQNSWLRIISSLSILLFFLFYVGSGLIAGGKLFNEVFGIDYELAVYVSVLLILVYTTFGGFLAVSWTDVFQAILMLVALVSVPILAVNQIGGTHAVLEEIGSKNVHFLDIFSDVDGNDLGVIAILSYLGWGLGYFGQPHVLSRYMAIDSAESVGKATKYAVLWAASCYTLAILVGLSGIGSFSENIADSEKVFILLTDLLFNPAIAGLFLAAILAAIMSTVDSQLLVCSASLAEDLYPIIRGKSISVKDKLRVGRISVIFLALLATLIALKPDSKVLDVVSYAWAGLGASLGPVIIFSLYYKKMNEIAAFIGIFIGSITVVIWDMLDGSVFELYSLVPAFILSSFSIIAVTNFYPKKDQSEGLH